MGASSGGPQSTTPWKLKKEFEHRTAMQDSMPADYVALQVAEWGKTYLPGEFKKAFTASFKAGYEATFGSVALLAKACEMPDDTKSTLLFLYARRSEAASEASSETASEASGEAVKRAVKKVLRSFGKLCALDGEVKIVQCSGGDCGELCAAREEFEGYLRLMAEGTEIVQCSGVCGDCGEFCAVREDFEQYLRLMAENCEFGDPASVEECKQDFARLASELFVTAFQECFGYPPPKALGYSFLEACVPAFTDALHTGFLEACKQAFYRLSDNTRHAEER